MTNQATSVQPTAFLELAKSMIGFMNAMTIFSIEQIKTSMMAVTDPADSVDRFRKTLDSMSRAMTNGLDSDSRATVRKMDTAVDRGVDAIRTDTGASTDDLTGRKA